VLAWPGVVSPGTAGPESLFFHFTALPCSPTYLRIRIHTPSFTQLNGRCACSVHLHPCIQAQHAASEIGRCIHEDMLLTVNANRAARRVPAHKRQGSGKDICVVSAYALSSSLNSHLNARRYRRRLHGQTGQKKPPKKSCASARSRRPWCRAVRRDVHGHSAPPKRRRRCLFGRCCIPSPNHSIPTPDAKGSLAIPIQLQRLRWIPFWDLVMRPA
jgi:hypothetical protein